MKQKITERFIFAYMLALVGGYIGGYSYSIRGGVFASAQTGNLIQLGLKISAGNYSAWYLHIFPIIMFSIGVMLCEYLKIAMADKKAIHWKQLILIIEAGVLVSVAFIPVGKLNLYATMLLGFAAGIQTQLVRVVEGTVLMTTMLSGNARTMTETFFHGLHSKDYEKLKMVSKQLGVFIFFIVGTMIAGFLSQQLGQYAIIFGVVFIVAAQILIFINRDNI